MKLLLGYARRILDLHDESLRRITAPALDGTLDLGIADHFVTERLPKLLSQFARTYPLVKLEVNSGIALMQSLNACRLNFVYRQ
ncbi:MAG TPA: hypothetical protein VN857_03195 [Chthoniobacterales bacterium]|nr:hypothetical protein [Chthoniobacterales bacterium]